MGWFCDDAPLEPGKSWLGAADNGVELWRLNAPSLALSEGDTGAEAIASENKDNWLGAVAGAALSRDIMDAQCTGFCAFFDAVQPHSKPLFRPGLLGLSGWLLSGVRIRVDAPHLTLDPGFYFTHQLVVLPAS